MYLVIRNHMAVFQFLQSFTVTDHAHLSQVRSETPHFALLLYVCQLGPNVTGSVFLLNCSSRFRSSVRTSLFREKTHMWVQCAPPPPLRQRGARSPSLAQSGKRAGSVTLFALSSAERREEGPGAAWGSGQPISILGPIRADPPPGCAITPVPPPPPVKPLWFTPSL